MSCPACGTATVPAARFCSACGARQPGTSSAEPAAERRVVTVLFGDLSDFTGWSEDLDPERVGFVTDRVLAMLVEAVTDFGGYVDKLTGDGLMAVFGAPLAHEDDAERAVRAAARMQAGVRRVVEQETGGGQALGLRVGLNTGEVLAGVQAHLSYTVIGDAVNTAARLADAAGVGAVLAGRDTALTTMGMASWRALAPLRLKGKREPVHAYELLETRVAGSGRSGLGDAAPMLGREAELGMLVGRVLDVADGGNPAAVLVTGEAGLGKSRLAAELARFTVELPGGRALRGRCSRYGDERELAPLLALARTACGIGAGDDAEASREAVARTVARLQGSPGLPARVSAERLQHLLGLDADRAAGPAGPAGATPGGAGPAGPALVAALLTALATEGPLLLVLDDLQWAGSELLAGVLELADGLRGPVLLVAAGRPEVLGTPAPDGRPWWSSLPEVELLPLLPLPEAALERLLRAHLGPAGDQLGSAARASLLARAQGNPFFLAELLHLLVDRGMLTHKQGRWSVPATTPDPLLPAGVQAVLAARIDELDEATKGVLRDASVLGTGLSAPLLAAIGCASGHGDPEIVASSLDTLLDRRLLEPGPDGLRFIHALVRDVAYAGLAKAERARRHAAAATALSSGDHGAPRLDQEVAEQAERALQLAAEMHLPASDPSWRAAELALPALARSGEAALQRDEKARAQALFARALALVGPATSPTLVAQLQVGHAQALVALHRYDQAARIADEALRGSPVPLRASALVVLGEVHRVAGRSAQAREVLLDALELASSGEHDATGSSRTAGDALRQLGLLEHREGRLRSAEQCFRQARDEAVLAGDSHGAGWALQHLAWSATTRGDVEAAEPALDEAAELFLGLEDAGGLAWVAGTHGYLHLLQGRFREAHELAHSLLSRSETSGERWGTAVLCTIDALAACELGDVESARQQARSAREAFRAVGDDWGRALSLVAEAAALRGTGEPAGAVALLEQAIAQTADGPYPLVHGLGLVLSGWCHLERHDPDAARTAAQRALEVLAGELEPRARFGADVLLAQVQRASGDLQGALERLDRALRNPSPAGLLLSRRQALAYRSGVLLQLGRTGAALDTAREAAGTPAEDIRSRVLGLRALGNALSADGRVEAAERVLREALDLARSTGQRSEVAGSERALAAAGALR